MAIEKNNRHFSQDSPQLISRRRAVLLGPPGDFRSVGEVLGTADQRYYRSLTDDELLQALRESLSKLQSGSVRLTQELRQHLLPALLALRERHMQPGRRKPIAGRPTYYEVLTSLNLKPDTVRKWFKQTASADDVLELLGQRRKRKRPSRRIDESAAQLLLATADQMAAELLNGNIEEATRLAHEYSEARDS